jgi:LacI family transcriptional regulator
MARKVFTLKEVAAEAGVHLSTVSRVMNPTTRHLVGDEVAARVLRVAKKLGYQPNRSAVTLRTRHSKTVGVLLPDITNPVFPPILRGIEEELRAAGYFALVADVQDDAQQLRVIEQMLGRQVDGLILATTTRRDPIIDYCLDNAIPVVSVNRSEDLERTSSVVHDEGAGMRLTVKHLVELGHRRIAHIAGLQHLSTGYLRRKGFIEAMSEAGIPDCVISDATAYSRESGRSACAALLAKHRDVTALVAANDLVALGCYDILRERGLVCPRDISVVGHNDMPFIDLVAPPLTTVRISHHEMGVQAARLILKRITREDESIMDIRIKPTLVIRESTAPPPRRKSRS